MNKFSFSRVNSILNCPRKYNEVPIESNVYLKFGLRLHNALELWIKENQVDSIMLETFDKDFINKIQNELQLNGNERLVSELLVETDTVKGYIDLLIIDDAQKEIMIVDLKTINDARLKHYDISRSEQLALYAKLFRILYPDFNQYNMSIGYLLYLKKSKHVKFTYDALTEDSMDAVYNNFIKKGNAARYIIDNELFYENENDFCTFCNLECNLKKKG